MENHLPARRVVVAIDGPAGSGKSTIARAVARRLGYVYIDTGAMYRAVALWAVRLGISPDDSHKVDELARQAKIEFAADSASVLLNGEDVSAAIREPAISEAASRVSRHAGVRQAMVKAQRAMAEGASVVMEGRDIGTQVFPGAAVKIYLDASPGVRTARRLEELEAKGTAVEAAHVARDLAGRDQRDRTRAEAPLMQAPDAVLIDTTDLSIGAVEEAVLKLVRSRFPHGKDVVR